MKINVKTIKNQPVDSNCFIVYNDVDCLIIDPGTEDCKELLSFLNKNKLVPQYIILTHEHFDHILGVNTLLYLYDCTLVCSVKCLELIADKKKNLSLFHNQIGFEIIPTNVKTVSDEILKLGKINIHFKETLGHSLGSISFWINDILFTGDVLIKDIKTVTKLPGGCKNQLKETIEYFQSLFKERNMIVYAGHGDIFCFKDVDFSKIV